MYRVFFVCIIALALVWLFTSVMSTTTSSPLNTSTVKTALVTLGSTTVTAEVANTESAREQGLSGREGLLPGQGMLFIFQTPGTYGFWMKDMRFSIDILFVDGNGKIITIYKDVSLESYTQSPPKVFYPAQPVQYVLEVPAGFVAAHTIGQHTKMVIQ